MKSYDVAIVGGGPAGSACAWKLRRAGIDVAVIDKATFPRDKVCAGWITPQVIEELELDPGEYRRGRTFQPITGFRVGVIGRCGTVDVSYGQPVSYGIRRCEFDEYLLRRSGACLMLGSRIATIRREGRDWVVGDSIRAPLLVGAGGHFCPVARMLNGSAEDAPLVVAREVEVPVARGDDTSTVEAEQPELYFCPDLTGYGWCFRKGDYLNVGFGRLDARGLPAATAAFVDFLKARGRISHDASWRWHGHAYLLSAARRRRAVGDATLLVGDAAGLAYPQSGEGIRPAIESGLLAAATIIQADGDYSSERLQSYVTGLTRRFATSRLASLLGRVIPESIPRTIAPRLLEQTWFVRRVVLDSWFLHAREAPLAGHA